MKKIAIVNGVNLNFTGIRHPEIYGVRTLDDINKTIADYCKSKNIEPIFFQSNSEGEIIDFLQKCRADKIDGVIINAGAHTHTSYALYDCISGISIPTVEVHMSNIHARDAFRDKSVIAPACVGQICGFGANSYLLAVDAFEKM